METETIIYAIKDGKFYKIKIEIIEMEEITEKEYNESKLRME